MVKTLLYLLSEGLVPLCVDLIPKSKKLFLDVARGCILEEFITHMCLRPLFRSLRLKAGGTDFWGFNVHSAGRSFEDSLNFKA